MLKIANRLSISWLSLFLLLSLSSHAIGGYYAYPFVGGWNNTDSPLTLGEYDFQDIRNLRRDGERLHAVRGHTAINTSVWDATDDTPLNGFHYKKDSPSESHVLILANNGSTGDASIYQNTTAVPGQGAFSGTTLHTDDSGATGVGRFSNVPNGMIAYANGEETLMWGGTEFFPLKLITTASDIGESISHPRDYTEWVAGYGDAGYYMEVSEGLNNSTTTLLLSVDSDFADSSAGGSGAVVSLYNAPSISSTAKHGDGSLYTTNGSSWITVDRSGGDYDFGSGDFSISMWVRWSSVPTADHNIFRRYVDANNHTLLEWVNSSTTFRFAQVNGGVDESWTCSTTWTPTANTWYHIAVIRGWGGVGTTMALTIDGTILGTSHTVSGSLGSHAADMSIGSTVAGTLDLWIDEIMITKGYSPWITTFTPSTTAYSAASNVWYVGSPIPLNTVKYYIQSANVSASTLIVKEWQGSNWVALSVTDNTASGGVSMAQTGTVTWTTTGLAKQSYLQGLSMYWYAFDLTGGSASAHGVTVSAPMSNTPNVWDGEESPVGMCFVYDNGEYNDYTDMAQSSVAEDVVSLPSLTAVTEHLMVGFTQPQQGLIVTVPAGKGNAVAGTDLSVYYHDNKKWIAVTDLVDRTVVSGIALSGSGTVTWQPIDEGSEFTSSINKSAPLYWYKLAWDLTLSADTEIATITGIRTTYDIPGYRFPVMFRDRLFLFSETNGQRNKSIYSAYGAPWVFNGDDSGMLLFGGGETLTAAAPLYNLYLSTGIDQLIVTKANETYRLEGSGPEDWEVQRISEVVGCVAPLSMTACGATDVGANAPRQVVMWQGSDGVYVCDGASVQSVSHPIRSYWDKSHANYIPAARQDDSVGWYDPSLDAYKLLISSGSGQATHNVELEYSLKYKTWTKLYREKASGANPLQVGFPVHDTVGNAYTYGATAEAKMYRLENGSKWNNVADIDQYVWTKDLFLDAEAPFFKDTLIEWLRVMFEYSAADDVISFTHYCNGTLTTNGVNHQETPTATYISAGPVYTTDVTLGPCHFHSLKIACPTIFEGTDGMELNGLGLVYQSFDAITE